jgi:hypothetical protein
MDVFQGWTVIGLLMCIVALTDTSHFDKHATPARVTILASGTLLWLLGVFMHIFAS